MQIEKKGLVGKTINVPKLCDVSLLMHLWQKQSMSFMFQLELIQIYADIFEKVLQHPLPFYHKYEISTQKKATTRLAFGGKMEKSC